MIVLRDLTKTYGRGPARRVVADRLNAVFPPGIAVGLLGRNGAGKTTLLRLMAGSADPTSGEVLSDGAVSFPIGFAGSFHPDMTGAQNTRFLARIYGVDTGALADHVAGLAGLGAQFHDPFRTYSAGMKARLAFAAAMGLSFDTYLVDEITAVGDAAFRERSRQVFLDRLGGAGVVFASHSIGMLREVCRAGAVLEAGRLHYCDDIAEAVERHLYNMRQGPEA